MTKLPVYYLPGHGGHLMTGLGQGILERGYSVTGREIRDEFSKLSFQEKIDIVSQDLMETFWREDARIIANSFGAYLFLHAQTQCPPFVGRVLLLSPIVGDFHHDQSHRGFIPPRADKILEWAQAGRMPVPRECEIHVGSEDWQSNPCNVKSLGKLMGIPVTVVPGGEHMLDKTYVGGVLDRWLADGA